MPPGLADGDDYHLFSFVKSLSKAFVQVKGHFSPKLLPRLAAAHVLQVVRVPSDVVPHAGARRVADVPAVQDHHLLHLDVLHEGVVLPQALQEGLDVVFPVHLPLVAALKAPQELSERCGVLQGLVAPLKLLNAQQV